VASAALKEENNVLKETVTGLERERDFYFSKLRDIELLIQQSMDANPELEKDEDGLLKQIQTILYSTEEGFEIPTEVEGEVEEELTNLEREFNGVKEPEQRIPELPHVPSREPVPSQKDRWKERTRERREEEEAMLA